MIKIRKLLNVGEESRLNLLPRRRRLSDTPLPRQHWGIELSHSMAADKDAGTPRVFLARHGLPISMFLSSCPMLTHYRSD